MSDEAAQVAAEETVAPEAIDNTTPPAPEEPTARGAIERAFDAVEKMDADPAPKADKEAAKSEETESTDSAGERERNPDGTFKAKEGTEDAVDKAEKDTKKAEDKDAKAEDKTDAAKKDGFQAAPDRFSPDAKEAWKDAPLPVRAEIHRLQQELEGGLEKYRERSDKYSEFEEFAGELEKTGQKFQDVLSHYRGIEDLLRRDPMGGLDQICRNMGTSLANVAQSVTNQTPEQATQHQQNAMHQMRNENNQLRQELAAIREEVTGVRTHVTSQAEQQVMQQINDFAQSHPRYHELEPQIAKLLEGGVASDLPEAYGMAEKLSPAPQAPASEAKPAPAHTQKGQLSPTGSPTSGSNPGNRQVPDSARAAIDQAFVRAGFG